MPSKNILTLLTFVAITISYDLLLIAYFNVPLIYDAASYLDLGLKSKSFYLTPSFENLYSIGMVREPLFISILGFFALLLNDQKTIVLTNMLVCHCLFVLTVIRVARSINEDPLCINLSATVAILGFGLIDLIIVPMSEGWQMILMGQLIFYLNVFFYKRNFTNKNFSIIVILISLMLLNRFGHSLFFLFTLSACLLFLFRKDKIPRNSIIKIAILSLLIISPVIIKNKIMFDRASVAWSGGPLHMDYRLRSAFSSSVFEPWKIGFFHINQKVAEKMFPKNCYIFSTLNSNKCNGSMFNMESSVQFLKISNLFMLEKSEEELVFSIKKNSEWLEFLSEPRTYINYVTSSISYLSAVPFSESLQFFRYYTGPPISDLYFNLIKFFSKFIFGPFFFIFAVVFLFNHKNDKLKLLILLSIICWILPTILFAVPNHRYLYPSMIFIYPLIGTLCMKVYDYLIQFIKEK